MSIKLNNVGITLRPSSMIEGQQCRRRWALTHLEGRRRPQNSRANLGTAIHKAAETMWNEAIKTGVKDLDIEKATDCAIAKYDDMAKDEEPQYFDKDTPDSIRSLIVSGVQVYMEDIADIADIPIAVEKRFSIPIDDHPIVREVAGTIDYLSYNTIADIKTSKRTITPQSHVIQQSIYKILAMANGYDIKFCLIHCVVFTKVNKGIILNLDYHTEQATYAISSTTKILDAFFHGTDPDVLFPGNTGYYLCSQKWCGFHADCPFVHGNTKVAV